MGNPGRRATPLQEGVEVSIYTNRHTPVVLIEEMRVLAVRLRTTIEDVCNRSLLIGVRELNRLRREEAKAAVARGESPNAGTIAGLKLPTTAILDTRMDSRVATVAAKEAAAAVATVATAATVDGATTTVVPTKRKRSHKKKTNASATTAHESA